MLKMIDKKPNTVGTWFGLVILQNGNFLVYKLCENYVLGKINKTWRYILPKQRMSYAETSKLSRTGMPEIEARALFTKRLAGKQK